MPELSRRAARAACAVAMAARRCARALGGSGRTPVSRLPSSSAILAVVIIDGLHVLAAGLDLRGRRRPVEDLHEQLVDQLQVVALGVTSLVNSLPGSAIASPRVGPLTRAMIGPSCKPLGTLAFAGAFTGRAAERRQEAAGQLHARVGQRRRPRSRRDARKLR